MPYAEVELAIPAAGPRELTATVRSVVAGQTATMLRDVLKVLVGRLDGDLSRRVAEAVRSHR